MANELTSEQEKLFTSSYGDNIKELLKHIKKMTPKDYITKEEIESLYPNLSKQQIKEMIMKLLDLQILSKVENAFICPHCKNFIDIVTIWNVGDEITCSYCDHSYYISDSDGQVIYRSALNK